MTKRQEEPRLLERFPYLVGCHSMPSNGRQLFQEASQSLLCCMGDQIHGLRAQCRDVMLSTCASRGTEDVFWWRLIMEIISTAGILFPPEVRPL